MWSQRRWLAALLAWLVACYERQGRGLLCKELALQVDQLPARLVRKFFHPSAFFNHTDRKTLLAQIFQTSPCYEPDPIEAPSLRPLTPQPNWQSAVCMPLADREDMIALLTLTSEKKGAFGSRVVGEIIPVKSMAALALAQHLHRARHAAPVDQEERAMRNAAEEFQDRIRHLRQHTAELEQENRDKNARLDALTREIEQLDRSSNGYRDELSRVKGMLQALEEQSAEATDHLNAAFEQLHESNARSEHFQRTITFLKDVFQVLAQEHDPQEFSAVMVSWFCENFGVERCSLMVLDDANQSMRIAAQQGIDPDVAGAVRVRVGQGISGWVAHNRKPLFIRVREDSRDVRPTGQDAYNSDSFIVVPLIHNDRLCGVLNLSNKRDGEPFDELDLDRATLAGSVLAMSLGGYETMRRVAAWA